MIPSLLCTNKVLTAAQKLPALRSKISASYRLPCPLPTVILQRAGIALGPFRSAETDLPSPLTSPLRQAEEDRNGHCESLRNLELPDVHVTYLARSFRVHSGSETAREDLGIAAESKSDKG